MVYGGSTLDGLRIPLDDGRSGRQRRRRNRMLFCVGVLVMGGVGVVFVRSLRSLEGAYTSASPGVSQAAQESSAIASRHFPDQVLKAMDLAADPCSDFYTYACGTFQEITHVEGDQNEWARSWSSVSARNNELLREVVETDRGLAGDFYRSCMNMSALNAIGNAPIQPYRRKLDKLKSCAARVPFERFHKDHERKCGIATLQPLIVDWHMIDIKVFFDWSVEVNPHEPNAYALNLMQDGITLPDPKWYFSGTAEAERRVAGLQKVAEEVLQLAGEDAAAAKEDAANVIKFERELARLFKDAEHERAATQGVYSLAEVQELSPALGLKAVLTALAGPFKVNLEHTSILIRNPDYFRGVTTLLHKTPASHLRAYLLFRLAFILGADLGDAFLDVGQQLQKMVVGQEHRVPRWYKCFNSVNHALPDYVGKIFVQRYFSIDILEEANKMLDNMRRVFEEELLALPWLDAVSKQEATYKLHAMFFSIGFPPHWADYKGLVLSGDFIQDGDRLYKWYIHHAFARLSRPVERNRWGTASPAMVDAFYSYDKNGIFVPAGILQKPFFSTTYRAARNYGAIGTILGHEMTHGFDDQGRKFNPEGRLKQWWTDADIDNFHSRAQCVVDLYSSMKVHGHAVNGDLTLGENIADIGGVKLAYKAFVRAAQEREGASAPSRPDRQLFFVAQAQNWCTKARPKAEALELLTDPHAPDRWRVNGPLSQVSEFAEAFGCPAASAMSPSSRCHVW